MWVKRHREKINQLGIQGMYISTFDDPKLRPDDFTVTVRLTNMARYQQVTSSIMLMVDSSKVTSRF
jgi:hypothetical protein